MSEDKIEASEPVVATNPTEDKAIDNTEGDVKSAVADEAAVKHEKSSEDTKEHKTGRKRTYEDGPLKGVLKTSRREAEDKSKNVKYDASILEKSSDPALIRGQVEFYFGDANLPTDSFLWKETDGATNNPVAIKKIHAFNRMKRFPDFDAVVAALRESKFLDVVEDKGEECVKRKVAYDPNTPRSQADARSVYVKGFGDEEPSSQFEIERFFLTYGATRQVRLRRTEEKLFKGSVFVEWEDDETQQKFLALDPKPEWRGNPLKIMAKKAYMAEKEDEIKDGKMEPKESWGPRSRGGRGGGYKNGRGGRDGDRGHRHNNRDRGDRDRGDRDPDDWKKRREEDQASGFKDDRRHRDHRDNRDKKGGRGNRHDRNSNGRNRDREDKNGGKDFKKEKVDTEAKAEVKDTEVKDAAPASSPNEKKRARDDDDVGEQPAKKVDSKSIAAEA